MTVAISQSNYIPWKGYFDMINQCDLFVFYDDMQYTKRDWRNRNKIKTAQGLSWLTLPVEVRGKYEQKINKTKIAEPNWAKKHLKSLQLNYAKAAEFKQFFPLVESWYEKAGQFEYLSDVNQYFTREIAKTFGITTEMKDSREFTITGSKTDALISVLDQIPDTSAYISGPAAQNYLDNTPFQKRSIEVKWMDYSNYPEYPQLFDSFEHGLTILDLLLNVGPQKQLFAK